MSILLRDSADNVYIHTKENTMSPEDIELMRKLCAMHNARTYTPEFMESCSYLVKKYPARTEADHALWNDAVAEAKKEPT